MPKLTDLKSDEKIRVLVYGPPKVGKTFGALSFPRPNVIDLDDGVRTGLNPDFAAKFPGQRDKILYERFVERNYDARGVVKTPVAFDEATAYFQKWNSDPELSAQFDTWVIDSGTSLSEAAMNKGLALLGGQGGFKGISSSTYSDALKHGLVFPKKQDYGSERSMVEQFIAMAKSSGKHLVFICHEKELTDNEGNTVGYVPLLTGKGVASIGAMFDEIWALKAIGSGTTLKRQIITRPEQLRMAGSRLGIPTGISFEYPAIKQALDTITATSVAP